MKKYLFIALNCLLGTTVLAQNVGINTTDPQYPLDVNGRMRLRAVRGTTPGIWYNQLDNSSPLHFVGNVNDTTFGIWNNNFGWRFYFDTKNNNLGIANAQPQYPLSFASTIGDKVSFWNETPTTPNSNHYGIGIQAARLQIFTPTTSDDIVFGYGRSESFTENMRIKGSGNVGIATSTPTTDLDVNGLIRMRGGNPGTGKVLTSDANGLASWTTPSNGLTLPFSGSGSSTTSHIFKILNTGTSLSAGYFANSSSSNQGIALQGISNSTSGFGTGIFGQANSGNGYVTFGVRGSLLGNNTAGYAVYGEANKATGVGGETQGGTGVEGIARASGGWAAYFAGYSGASAVHTYGALQLENIGEDDGAVLTSDAEGNATWQKPASLGTGFNTGISPSLTIFNNTSAYIPFKIVNTTSPGYFDDSKTFTSTTHYYTAPADGTYHFDFSVSFSSGGANATLGTDDGAITFSLRVNGDSYEVAPIDIQVASGQPLPRGASTSALVKLTAGDHVSIFCYNNNAGNIVLQNGAGTNFSGYRVY